MQSYWSHKYNTSEPRTTDVNLRGQNLNLQSSQSGVRLDQRERRWSGANPNAATTHVIVCKVLDAATSGYCRHSRTKQSKDRHRKQSQCRIWSSGGGGVNISNQQMHSVGARSMFGIPLTLTIDMDWDMSIASYPCTCTYLILLSVMWWYYLLLLLLLLLLYRA